jgi:hypothetical protein
VNRNGTITTIDAGRSALPLNQDKAYEMVAGGGERIQDLIRQSTLELQQVLAEIRETISKTEAEIEMAEKISVVVERDRTVASVERSFRFAKDR